MGRDPATGEAIKIAAKKVVKFRVAKAAKGAIVSPKRTRPKHTSFEIFRLAAETAVAGLVPCF
jgi:hypothetical protein